MRTLALLLALLATGCHGKAGAAPAVGAGPTPVVVVPAAQCTPFALALSTPRRVSSQTVTISGGVLIEVKGYGVKTGPATYSPLPLDQWYEVRGTDSSGCWSAWSAFYFASNPAADAEPPTQPPIVEPPCPMTRDVCRSDQ